MKNLTKSTDPRCEYYEFLLPDVKSKLDEVYNTCYKCQEGYFVNKDYSCLTMSIPHCKKYNKEESIIKEETEFVYCSECDDGYVG